MKLFSPLFRRASLLCLLALSVCSHAQAQVQYLWLEEPWRPADEPILEVHYEEITDEDIFLWQILNENPPEAARLRRTDSGELEAVYPQSLRQAVQSLAEAMVLAYLPEAEQGLDRAIGQKAARITASRVAMVVFADYMVLPDVEVTQFDVANYYRENIDRYSTPAVLEVLALEIPVTDPLNPAMREEARQRAIAIRRDAISGGGLAAIARQHPDLARPKEITVHQGQEDVPPMIESALMDLAASQISQPQFLGENVLLYEVVTRTPAERIPLEQVAPEIAERLRRRVFGQQMRYRVEERIRQARPTSRAQHFSLLEDEMLLLQVGDFMLTKGEFLTLYPQYRNLEGKTPDDLKRKIDEIIRGEVITQYLQSEGLLAAPRYEKAMELATELIYSRNASRQLHLEADPTEEEIKRYLEQHREELAPPVTRYIWKLEGKPTRAEELSGARRAEIQQRLRERISAIVQEAERLIDERARISGEVAYVSPQFVIDRLIGPQSEDYSIAFNRVGVKTPLAARQELGIAFGDAAVGQFTDMVSYNDGSVLAYYFADEQALKAPDDAELLKRAREALVEMTGRQPAIEELDRQNARGAIRWYINVPSGN